MACLCATLFYVNGMAQKASHTNFNTTEELRSRSGLPNFFSKIKSGKKVRVAYLGGSITHQEGWRPKTFKWLEKQYPKTFFEMINAAVPGTGADFANCRLESDLLAYKPDLVFVEFRVNGSGGFGVRAHEGIVRKIWKDNPEIDICFVYTIGINMVDNIRNGLQHGEGKKMEQTAIHYNIPSIDLGIEVVKQLDKGNFVYKGKPLNEGQKVFCRDNVHPKDAGYELYKDVVTRSLLAMEGLGQIGGHNIPKPIEKKYFDKATFIPVSKAKLSDGWEKVDVKKDISYTSNLFRTDKMLKEAVKSDREGETIHIKWEGKLIGFSTFPFGNGTEIEISIDGGVPKKYLFDKKRNTTNKKSKVIFSSNFYAPEQKSGKHEAVLKIVKLAKGASFYSGQFWVIDSPKNIQ